MRLTIGFMINPFAGIGGAVALKGSDGAEIRALALKKGAIKQANQKALITLSSIPESLRSQVRLLTPSGEMGEDVAKSLGFNVEVISVASMPSESSDTKSFIKTLQSYDIDLILFAGGDGTARDVLTSLDREIPVLGIPAGCKIHSGVYSITPKAAGELITELLQGSVLSIREASVMDIDEDAFRAGTVKAKTFGAMSVPDFVQYVQSTKEGGKEVESVVLEDIAADIVEQMEPSVYYAIGSGSTCQIIMEELGLDNTLLGVDVIKDHVLVQKDVTASDLLAIAKEHPLIVVLTVIGGQGHLLGRGNQQISAELIRKIGWDNVWVIATKSKLNSLKGAPLIVDTGDLELDDSLTGVKKIITGYHDTSLYHVGR